MQISRKTNKRNENVGNRDDDDAVAPSPKLSQNNSKEKKKKGRAFTHSDFKRIFNIQTQSCKTKF